MAHDLRNPLTAASIALETFLQVAPRKLNLRSLCSKVIVSFQAKLNHKKQSINTDIPQDLPFVYADTDQVQRVLTNLIDNAIKYTPANGQIGIIALYRTTEKVQISIRDTGPGIPRENQKLIFEENFRLKRDQTKDGYGLGLALCQLIVRAHYDQIWVDSKQGKGSCFHFTLPVYRG